MKERRERRKEGREDWREYFEEKREEEERGQEGKPAKQMNEWQKENKAPHLERIEPSFFPPCWKTKKKLDENTVGWFL